MATLKLEDKKAIVSVVNEQAMSAVSAAIADYSGLSVSQMDALRKQARDQQVSLRVVRNTLARRAVIGTDFECLVDSLVGPLILAFAYHDPGSVARLFKAFAKTSDKFEVKALALGRRVYGVSEIDAIASLPTRDQALSTLMQLMLTPATLLVRTLNEVPTQVVRAVDAVGQQKSNAV